jgi:hypothetical protein
LGSLNIDFMRAFRPLSACSLWLELMGRVDSNHRPPGPEPDKGISAKLLKKRHFKSGVAQLITLGETLHSWSEEIARMWRFTRPNGITEGFHNKMETFNRQAYGFRNFENYRLRVKVLCS